ncbi:hypothetical protein SAMN05421856_1195 [Chryseobacterium taichungense]|uniref:Uncharacterized protein n=1 Tax=Chryseobacterium taichungense TaxID=295069 RepID=A0A1H8DWK8_9FLAO|nr:hypothetical protein [Chryseobacterium taichungense]SEN11600.1 hypothetical protein SAMN05421856_1195 [Chryseobacterium taichungense]
MGNIKKDNVKLSIITLIMLLILAFGIIAVTNPSKYTSFIYRNGLIIFLVGLISIVISTFLIYLFGRKLFDKNAIFSIDSIGISDKVNILDYPFIKWKNRRISSK